MKKTSRLTYKCISELIVVLRESLEVHSVRKAYYYVFVVLQLLWEILL